ncbi:YfiR family protein [Novosphingobium sp.]|uniref:YfiR family protein n=1 Tax=Novosphingobium sp. TaxID=1874826 RepID=UPI0035B39E63
MRAPFFLFAAVFALTAPQVRAAGLDMPLGPAPRGSDPYAAAVARTVQAMIDYTRWPDQPDPLLLCTVGAVSHAEQLGELTLADGHKVQHRQVAASPAALGGCDVVYLGALGLTEQRQLTGAVRGRAVLTIAESDPDCRSEAMFCLLLEPQALNFRLNLDAVSRSGLKVDPRVLRMAKGGM